MDHEAIQEILAGHVLHALSGEEARRAESLLAEHVPSCAICRDAVDGFQRLAGDLALGALVGPVPDVLLARLHREIRGSRRWRSVGLAGAAAAALIIAIAGFAVTQEGRANHLAEQRATLARFLDFSTRPDASRVPVGPMTEIARPGIEQFYIYGQGVPAPRPGYVYSLWLESGPSSLNPSFRHIADFIPDDGFVLLPIAFDPTLFRRVVISLEPQSRPRSSPSGESWSSPT
jgi:hypothetical protein